MATVFIHQPQRPQAGHTDTVAWLDLYDRQGTMLSLLFTDPAERLVFAESLLAACEKP